MKLLLTGQLTKLILGTLDKNKKVTSENKVYFPTYFGVIGIVFSLLCGLGIYYSVKLDSPVFITIIAGAFLIMGLAMIIVWINKQISFNENCFTYRSFWGIKKQYTYEQIVSRWGDSESGYKLFTDDKRKISVDKIMCNAEEFFFFANKKYNQIHAGRLIPESKKKDIFNNNLRNPSDYIALFVIICLCWCTMIGLGIWGYIDNKDMNESDCDYIASEVIGYRKDENNLILTVKGFKEEMHIEGFYDFAKNQEEFLTLCNENKTFDAWCRYSDSDNPMETAYYNIAKISYNETVFYSFEDYDKALESSKWILLTGIVVCSLCMAGLMALFLAVARNPHKFSPKLVKALIKPSEFVGYEKTRKQTRKRKYKK